MQSVSVGNVQHSSFALGTAEQETETAVFTFCLFPGVGGPGVCRTSMHDSILQ